MNKIVFNDSTEIEIANVVQSGDSLTVEIDTEDVNSVIKKFSDKNITSVMRYYAGIDLIRGYAGFTKMKSVEFTPDVVTEIDYSVTDQATESGFVEKTTSKCTVTMKKVSLITSIASQTAQNAANIDYLSMETGIEI